jgi:hypothetical protein
VNSYLTWSSWRVWPWHDEALREKDPHRPSAIGKNILVVIEQLAKRTGHPQHEALNRLSNTLPTYLKMHDKTAPIHRFELSELEAIALALMAEARRMDTSRPAIHPGAGQAIRFQLGLLLQLLWRNPMRARNWCEAIMGINLKQHAGRWRWRFVGTEMKIGMRGTEPNVFEPDVPPEVAVHLDEFLSHYRHHLPNAASDRHVFLSIRGTPMSEANLLATLKGHVARFTDKAFYTHLARSLFSTYHLTHGMDINSVAYAMNDRPQSVLKAYNELMADTHRPIIAEANRQALANGHQRLTPPIIPVATKPKLINPDQLTLI